VIERGRRHLEWVALVWERVHARSTHGCINHSKRRQVWVTERMWAAREVCTGQPFEGGVGEARW
jgi:hypothetical protein